MKWEIEYKYKQGTHQSHRNWPWFLCCRIHRSWTCPIQHDLLVLLRDVLGEKGRNIECVSQDPEYHEFEKAIYGIQGIQLIEDPQGFLHVDDESFVITIAASAPVRKLVMDLALPAAMIWLQRSAPLYSELLQSDFLAVAHRRRIQSHA